jgi:hypothetical protein
MNPKATELDVDFIGGQDPMTKEEELAISEFIKARELPRAKKNTKNTKDTQSIKVIA